MSDRREEIRERLERDYSFVEGRRKALADIAYLLERVEELEGALEEIRRETDPDRIRITGREPQVDRVWHLARQALESEGGKR